MRPKRLNDPSGNEYNGQRERKQQEEDWPENFSHASVLGTKLRSAGVLACIKYRRPPACRRDARYSMQASPQNWCKFFRQVRNFSAALPPGCAEMLCISDHRLQIDREATPRAARHSLAKILHAGAESQRLSAQQCGRAAGSSVPLFLRSFSTARGSPFFRE